MDNKKQPNYDCFLSDIISDLNSSSSTKKSKKIQKSITDIIKQNQKNTQDVLFCINDFNEFGNIQRLSNSLKKRHLRIKPVIRNQTSRIEKDLVRYDFYGFIEKIDSDKLSEAYLHNKKNPTLTEPLDFIDIKSNGSWAIIKQFPNFYKIEEKVLNQLNKMSISKETLSNMIPEDFLDAAYKMSRKTGDKQKIMFNGEKTKFVKDFINRFEKPLTQILKYMDTDERYIKSLVKSMKKRGCCANIEVYDEDKNLIKGPMLSIDHKDPIQNLSEGKNIVEKNLFSNLRILIHPIHEDIIHGIKPNPKESEFITVDFEDPNLVFALTIDKITHISFDYANSSLEIKKRKEMDYIKNEIDLYVDLDSVQNENFEEELDEKFEEELAISEDNNGIMNNILKEYYLDARSY